VWKVFRDETVAIRSLDLEIQKGEFFVFLGPSGSGKSTLLRTVAGRSRRTSSRSRLE
jgi:ABC-type Fe3+/spermidine/putrescine transport system ATPase subunit